MTEVTQHNPRGKNPLSRRLLPEGRKLNWRGSTPFILTHLAPFGLLWTGIRPIDVAVCVGLYFLRMFFITAGYHRYFAHRSYKMNRITQALMALGGSLAAQKGPLWWAAHHRHHHRFSDQAEDIHSPKDGFFWSHIGWMMCADFDDTRFDLIPDFAKYPELRLLGRFWLVPPILLGYGLWLWQGWSMLWGGFFLSTVFLYHGTFTINSLSHLFGSRRFATDDTSRNNFWLALVTLGEGWHNNHHHFCGAAKQGFYWWEIDISYYGIRALSLVGLTYDIRTPPEKILEKNRLDHGVHDIGMLGPLEELSLEAP
jgi:stearoyl-CoA desaturase (delta-9 desaturase)